MNTTLSVDPSCWEKVTDEVEKWLSGNNDRPIEDCISSQFDPCRRTYFSANFVLKVCIMNSDTKPQSRNQTLLEEYKLLNQLEGRGRTPAVEAYLEKDGVQILCLRRFRGVALGASDLSIGRYLGILFQSFVAIGGLSLRGISHNDLCDRNVLISSDRELMIIDLDQSSAHSVPVAAIRNFLGISTGETENFGSYMRIIKSVIKAVLPDKVVNGIRVLMGKNYHEDISNKLPSLEEGANQSLKKLLKAWEIAQESDASAPGFKHAYYSYDFGGVHFPGERSWSKRWEILKKVSNYQGKRILELGCNLGLLSTHLVYECSASAALGIDYDEQIIAAAELIDLAHGVSVQREVVDLDSNEDWEQELFQFNPDIVFALNVLNWVRDQDRLMRFLGSFDEVIFEGHDSLEVEKGRFEAVGFREVELVTYTERKRPVLHCKKRD